MWMETLNEIFTHKLQLCTVSIDAYGSNSITAVQTLDVFSFQSDYTKVDGGTATTTNHAVWQVVFQSSDRALIKIGSVVRDIVDSDGFTVVSLARISDITAYTHWQHGLQAFIADLELN